MKLSFWGGLLLIVLSLIISLSNYSQYKVQRDGEIVKMQITMVPASCVGTKVKHYANFFYSGKTYIKQVGTKFCDSHYAGEYIDMKYLEGDTLILFPGESVVGAFYIFGCSALAGLVMVLVSLFKK